MPAPAPSSPDKPSGSWYERVKTRKAEPNVREEFYKDVANSRLKSLSKDVDQVLQDPKSGGVLTYEEIEKGAVSPFDRIINPKGLKIQDVYKEKGKQGWTMNEILTDYFRDNVGITDPKQLGREVAVSLYYLTQQGVNVDFLNAKWRVNIIGARLYVYDKDSNPKTDGAKLRPQSVLQTAPAPTLTPAPAPAPAPEPKDVPAPFQDWLTEEPKSVPPAAPAAPAAAPITEPAPSSVPAPKEGAPVPPPFQNWLEVGKPKADSTGDVPPGLQSFLEE